MRGSMRPLTGSLTIWYNGRETETESEREIERGGQETVTVDFHYGKSVGFLLNGRDLVFCVYLFKGKSDRGPEILETEGLSVFPPTARVSRFPGEDAWVSVKSSRVSAWSEISMAISLFLLLSKSSRKGVKTERDLLKFSGFGGRGEG